MSWVDEIPLRLVPRRQQTAEQKARAKRRSDRESKWRKAHHARARWTPEQFEEEEARLASEIDRIVAEKKAS